MDHGRPSPHIMQKVALFCRNALLDLELTFDAFSGASNALIYGDLAGWIIKESVFKKCWQVWGGTAASMKRRGPVFLINNGLARLLARTHACNCEGWPKERHSEWISVSIRPLESFRASYIICTARVERRNLLERRLGQKTVCLQPRRIQQVHSQTSLTSLASVVMLLPGPLLQMRLRRGP